MRTFHTKRFEVHSDIALEIDAWINGFRKKDVPEVFNNVEVVGYVTVGSSIIVTVAVWLSGGTYKHMDGSECCNICNKTKSEGCKHI